MGYEVGPQHGCETLQWDGEGDNETVSSFSSTSEACRKEKASRGLDDLINPGSQGAGETQSQTLSKQQKGSYSSK